MQIIALLYPTIFRIKDTYIIKSDIPLWSKGHSRESSTQLAAPVIARVSEMPAMYSVAEHQHPWGQLAYAAEGIMTVKTLNTSYIIPPQRALWLPSYTPHTISTQFGLSFRSLYIDNQLAAALPSQTTAIEVNALLREIILSIAGWPREYSRSHATNNLIQVLIDQISGASRAPLYLNMPKDKRLLKITERLSLDPACNISLQQWSLTIGATPRTLNRLFIKETKMGFVAWRQRLRILFSLERLARGETINTVAIELGYESGSAFITMFKKHLGLPPKTYFNQSRENAAKIANSPIESAS